MPQLQLTGCNKQNHFTRWVFSNTAASSGGATSAGSSSPCSSRRPLVTHQGIRYAGAGGCHPFLKLIPPMLGASCNPCGPSDAIAAL